MTRRLCSRSFSRRVHHAFNCSRISLRAIGRDEDVYVIRPAIHCVKRPATNSAMVGNGRFDDSALFKVEATGVFRYCAAACCSRIGSGSCIPCRYLTHPRSSPGSHVPYVGQVRK